ncbi:MAG: hypothetical protein WBK53_09480, partial [Halanaerobiales bacterium]
WESYKIYRRFRNKDFYIEVKNPDRVSTGIKELRVNGELVEGNLIPLEIMQEENQVDLVLG